MTWTKNTTVTLPATGSRTISMITEGGVQLVRYQVIATNGDGFTTTFPLSAFLADNPSVDAGVLAATMALFRAYGDTQCGFSDV